MKFILSTFAALALISTSASAQLLRVEVTDTALQHKAMLVSNYGIDSVKFDSKGVYIFNNEKIKKQDKVMIMLCDYSTYDAAVEPGKTLILRIDRKKGKNNASYKGDNADLSDYLNKMDQFRPEKSSSYEKGNPGTDTISHQEAFKRLSAKYDALTKLVAKMKNVSETDRKNYKSYVEWKNLNNKITLLADKDWKYGIDTKNDAEYQKLINQINPNDTSYLNYNLIATYISAKIPLKLDSNTNLTEYGLSYINTVARYITNPSIKHLMLDNLTNEIIGVNGVDIAKYWNALKQQGDSSIIKQYQYIVDAKLNTRSGMKCPDVTFSDPDGKSHHLSDFFGKTLYIDLWATWCGPCCAEIPYLEKMVEHYKTNNHIQFISISLDTNHDAWLNKVKTDKPAWQQFNVNKEEDRIISTQWGVMSIPRFLIINPDGTICDNDAFRPSDTNFISKLDAIIK
jgi:thiol-disulfide isomerase/thioredoxin